MKKVVFFVLAAVMLLSSSAYAETKKNNIEISAGVFKPGSDYDDYGGWDNGRDFTINYIRSLNDFFAVEAGLHVYNTEMEGGWVAGDIWGNWYDLDGEVSTVGFEVLGRLYKKFNEGFRIYGAAGLGLYSNDIEQRVGGYKFDDSGRAVGFVGKLGFDYIFSNGIYLGLNVKHFINDQEIEFYDGSKDDIDLGGTSYGITVGYNF